MRTKGYARGLAVVLALSAGTIAQPAYAQGPRVTATPQKLDEDYGARIKKATPDPRIITELVDHMPVSATVPSPLKFFGYVPGEPGNLTYHADIVRYYEALEKASPRVKLFRVGKSEEGRDMVALAIADEATIKQLDKYKQITAKLTDPRKLQEAEARQLIATGKPIYYATGSIHTPETGSPEMLIELAFRLAVEESPFIQTIRNNSIVVLTPSTEVDGREKAVDNFKWAAKNPGKAQPGLVYWGQYVQHDNNRDGIGVGLNLTNNILKSFLDWHPQVFHDLHESVTLLYVSTGTGPYNTVVDPIQVNEWWLLAQNEMMEMAKRNVPGVWTYNYYDGWVPNYLFWIGVTHNSIGRFYETQSYPRGGGGGGGGGRGAAPGPPATNGGAAADSTNLDPQAPQPAAPVAAQPPNSGCGRPAGPNSSFPPANEREWYRPFPNPGCIEWSGRSNVNMQESALLLTLNLVA